MKRINLIIAIIALIGQLLGFIGILISETKDQLMFSLWAFLGFCLIGAITLIKQNLVK